MVMCRQEVVCPIYLTPYLLVLTVPSKICLSMLLADAIEGRQERRKKTIPEHPMSGKVFFMNCSSNT